MERPIRVGIYGLFFFREDQFWLELMKLVNILLLC